MKICYAWIEHFRNFENFGFNLSSSFKFKYDSKNNFISAIKVEQIPEDFFGERITDVVGIIGKNGAGKSNALELICKILKGAKTSLQSNFFIIIEEQKHFICYYSFTSRQQPQADINIAFKEYDGNINPLKVVFFSNVFDERENDFDREVSDISVNNLYRKNAFFRRKQTTAFEKQIMFINSKIFSYLNIELPKEVQLTSKVWINRLNSSMERAVYRDSYESIREFKRVFRDRIRDIVKPDNKFINLFRFGYFFEMFNNYSQRNSFRGIEFPHLFENIVQILTNFNSIRATEEITEKLITYLEQEFSKIQPGQMNLFQERGRDNVTELQISKIREQIEFIKNIKYYIDKLNIKYYSEGARNRGLEYFVFEYESNASKNFINEFVNLFEQSSVININWLGISSGHKAYLNLFASLYLEFRKTRHPNILLCIDEGDLYLHPKWQIEFFDKLLKVLPLISSGKIQLILTSHSPFLLSDLPKQNVTILNIEVPGSTIDGVDLIINTFGANLYDLYSEPFFLGNKRTSDFAYNKISDLIDRAEKKKLSNKEKINITKVSNILGDEIIQYKIKKLIGND